MRQAYYHQDVNMWNFTYHQCRNKLKNYWKGKDESDFYVVTYLFLQDYFFVAKAVSKKEGVILFVLLSVCLTISLETQVYCISWAT